MSDDAANLLAFLRNGIPPAQQLINLLQAQHQLQQNQQQQAVFNSMPYLSPLQLLQNQLNNNDPNLLVNQHSPQKIQQPQPNVHPAQQQTKFPKPGQFSPSLTALKLNLENHQMHNPMQVHQNQPLSSSTSIDEGVMTSTNSPTETVSGTVSPMHDDREEHGLPKEPEHASLKRPAAIQDMLMKKKKKRLDGVLDGLMMNKKVAFDFLKT